ncbi:MAG: TRAP transporter fused permease subunit [Burkholderiaceae bacterium]
MNRADFPGWVKIACAWCLPVLGIVWLISVPQRLGLQIVTQQVVAIALGLALAIVLLAFPYGKKASWWDLTLALLGAACWFWYAWNFNDWVLALANRTPDMWIPGAIGLVLLVEGVRKSVGLVIALLVWLVIAYGLFGDHLPGTLQAEVFPVDRLILYLYADSNGVPGTVLTVITTLVLPYVILGKMMEISGGMDFFKNLAFRLVGGRRGGPAQAAVVASGFFGTLSGSTVANIMSTGIVTIPIMRKSGFAPEQAAAVEAVASNGGQIMPPIMGATAFIIAEFLQIEYREVVFAALIPALAYYMALMLKIDALAVRRGIAGVALDDVPPLKTILLSGWNVMLPFAFLVYLLFWRGYNPGLAALLTTGVMLAGYVLETRMRPDLRRLLQALGECGGELGPLLLIGGAAGIFVGLMNSTGFAFQLSLMLTHVATEYGLLMLLVLAAVVSIVLGMGMPTAAVYIVLVTVVAPAIVDFGVDALGAHLFLFYFGLMSMLTPPIAIGSIVAARLANADMWKTGYYGMRLALSAYVLPFLWIYNPAVLTHGTPFEVFVVVSNIVVAAFLLRQSMLASPVVFLPGALFGTLATVAALAVGGATVWLGASSLWALACSALGLLFVLACRRLGPEPPQVGIAGAAKPRSA